MSVEGDIARLAEAEVASLVPVRGGGNNRLYRVGLSDGRVVAAKSYPPPTAADPRDRLDTEYRALAFLAGRAPVPAPVARGDGLALYQWIEGERVDHPTSAHVEACLAFVAELRHLSREPEAAALPLASEACLSAAELCRQVERRLERLRTEASTHPALADFLTAEFEPVMARARQRLAAAMESDAELDPAWRCLSPSDFGLHNALMGSQGLMFLDFEYFGWDDPVKLAADFVLHPGMKLNGEQRRQFLAGMRRLFSDDARFAPRLAALLPLYALRWAMIVLNEFLPERWARRVFAGASDRAAAEQVQLAKARRLVITSDEGVLYE